MKPIVGLDVAPTHGAVARVRWTGDRPREIELLGHYHGTADIPVKTPFMKTTEPGTLVTLGNFLADWVSGIVTPADPVFLDFSLLGTAFLPSGRVYAAKWCFVVGSFLTTMELRNYSVLSLEPGDMRRFLGLKSNAKKEAVWVAFTEQFPDLEFPRSFSKLPAVVQSDYRDAVILSVIGGLSWD